MASPRTLSIATWNINSVRLRIDNVVRYLSSETPDILCLQETKCPQGQFPAAALKALGYVHIAEHGQKGYHGVAIVSRLPMVSSAARSFCGKEDCRHIAAVFDAPSRFVLHNFYVPAGGDEPDVSVNPKFAHKLSFLDEMEAWSRSEARGDGREAVVVGDLNIAPLEHDVWSSKDLKKVVSHTPIERQRLGEVMAAGDWLDVMRQHVPADQKLYTWWSYRAKDWDVSNRGRRLDHVWASPGLATKSKGIEVLRDCRSWTQPSDHVPVLARFAV
jgi:exodeoxyribonuclease III